ncbi:hypothetical protein ATE71_12325 [Sphingopyxis sp. H115]|nr:hypothetical protein ATE71_12325 [Sphingopyxis sp. H115]
MPAMRLTTSSETRGSSASADVDMTSRDLDFVSQLEHGVDTANWSSCLSFIAAAINFKAAGLAEINLASSSARPMPPASPRAVDFGLWRLLAGEFMP